MVVDRSEFESEEREGDDAKLRRVPTPLDSALTSREPLAAVKDWMEGGDVFGSRQRSPVRGSGQAGNSGSHSSGGIESTGSRDSMSQRPPGTRAPTRACKRRCRARRERDWESRGEGRCQMQATCEPPDAEEEGEMSMGGKRDPALSESMSPRFPPAVPTCCGDLLGERTTVGALHARSPATAGKKHVALVDRDLVSPDPGRPAPPQQAIHSTTDAPGHRESRSGAGGGVAFGRGRAVSSQSLERCVSSQACAFLRDVGPGRNTPTSLFRRPRGVGEAEGNSRSLAVGPNLAAEKQPQPQGAASDEVRSDRLAGRWEALKREWDAAVDGDGRPDGICTSLLLAFSGAGVENGAREDGFESQMLIAKAAKIPRAYMIITGATGRRARSGCGEMLLAVEMVWVETSPYL
ncbi:unnamed protein product [Diplocarpon coronariae]